jgi:mono/diheme cytochrome c family protein
MWPLVVFGLGAIVFVVQLAGVAQSDAQNVAAASSWQDDHDAEAPSEDEGVETDDGPRAERLADAEQLREGAQAYSQMCASCHQAGGIGIVGQFPPLRDNPNVDDGDYLRTVITTGRAGELEVDGVLYDGVMPSFSTLPDDDTDAIVAFIQNDFVAPPIAIIPQAGPIAGTELPGFSNMAKWLSYLIAGTAALLVLAPRITSANDRLSFPWLDAWLRTAIIVAAVILLIVVIPDWAVRNSAVTKLSRFSQDLIGVSLWLAGLVAVLWGLWYAQRESRL